MTKIPSIFFGTHQFAATILEGLIKSPFIDVRLVITQPDRPVGRKQEVQKSPVKLLAEKNNLSIEQPTSLQKLEIRNLKLEIGICAQYGLLIPDHILSTPRYGILNVHTSLLPKYRGASPIQSALMNGETVTGITIMKMDKGLDTGPILLQKPLAIRPDDTYLDLDKKLALLGRDALLEVIPKYVAGELVPIPQNENGVSYCSELTRNDGRINWQKTNTEIYNQYRGLTPWPGVWTMWKDKRLKLLNIRPARVQLAPGQMMAEKDTLFIGCQEGSMEVLSLQLEGKKAVDTKTFLTGYHLLSNEQLT